MLEAELKSLESDLLVQDFETRIVAQNVECSAVRLPKES